MERTEGGREAFALVLLPADRGQGEAGGAAGGVEAFADRVAEDRVGADLQEHVVAVGGDPVDAERKRTRSRTFLHQ